MKDYIRGIMKEAHEKGTPVMLTLFYEFPDDNCWDIYDEYMFGNEILVAPICHKHETRREVYLPTGHSWTSAHNGEVYEGGKTYNIDAPIDTIPVFLKDDSNKYLIGEI